MLPLQRVTTEWRRVIGSPLLRWSAPMSLLRHRSVLLALSLLPLALAGCVGDPQTATLAVAAPPLVPGTKPVAVAALDPRYSALYQPIGGEPFEVPGVPRSVVRKGFVSPVEATCNRDVATCTRPRPHLPVFRLRIALVLQHRCRY